VRARASRVKDRRAGNRETRSGEPRQAAAEVAFSSGP
jgi:hypothetical protein